METKPQRGPKKKETRGKEKKDVRRLTGGVDLGGLLGLLGLGLVLLDGGSGVGRGGLARGSSLLAALVAGSDVLFFFFFRSVGEMR